MEIYLIILVDKLFYKGKINIYTLKILSLYNKYS